MLDHRYNEEVSSFFHFFQVELLRLRCEGQPSTENLEHIVTRLEQSDQLTQETLDDMLCRTPTGKRRPVVEERKTSRRTLRLLQSSLLTEWEVPCAGTKDSHTSIPSRNSILVTAAASTSSQTRTHIWRKLDCFPFLLFDLKLVRIITSTVQRWINTKLMEECGGFV